MSTVFTFPSPSLCSLKWEQQKALIKTVSEKGEREFLLTQHHKFGEEGKLRKVFPLRTLREMNYDREGISDCFHFAK